MRNEIGDSPTRKSKIKNTVLIKKVDKNMGKNAIGRQTTAHNTSNNMRISCVPEAFLINGNFVNTAINNMKREKKCH